MKNNTRRDAVIDALKELIMKGEGSKCSVNDIARQAGIGKATTYYYFSSKEEIFDALIERTYSEIIEECKMVVGNSNLSAIKKIEVLFDTYFSSDLIAQIDQYLHQPENAYIHQKSVAKIFSSLSPIVTGCIEQGIKEKVFECEYPKECAELLLSEYCFVFDPGIFKWSDTELNRKVRYLPQAWELLLNAPKGSFDFLIK